MWDQQLYKIGIDIIFNDMDRFFDLVPILGGMHFLQSFVSAIVTLTGSLGLRVRMGGAFYSIDAMLNDKNHSYNVRALRMVPIYYQYYQTHLTHILLKICSNLISSILAPYVFMIEVTFTFELTFDLLYTL